jgi:hypothetical protein
MMNHDDENDDNVLFDRVALVDIPVEMTIDEWVAIILG